jgi:hypothetical protein
VIFYRPRFRAKPVLPLLNRRFLMSYFTRLVKETLANTRVGGLLGRIPFVETAYGRHFVFRKDHGRLFYGLY